MCIRDSHYMIHAAPHAFYMSPRASWNYCGEDVMQKTKGLCQGAQKGSSPQLVASTVIGKCGVGLDLLFVAAKHWWSRNK
eukprot:13828991-Alexandrium_andersonii.AAC.1